MLRCIRWMNQVVILKVWPRNSFLSLASPECPLKLHSVNVTDTHYNDVIMRTMSSQISGPTIVYSMVYWGADQRKHQSSASLAFMPAIHRWPVNSPHKGTVSCFHLMTSSCDWWQAITGADDGLARSSRKPLPETRCQQHMINDNR